MKQKFDKPESGHNVNRLLDELASASDTGEMVFVDDWFYDPDAVSSKAREIAAAVSRPVKRYVSPRLMISAESGHDIDIGLSYYIDDSRLFSVKYEPEWQMENRFRREDKLFILGKSSTAATGDISIENNKSIVAGLHGQGLFTEGEFKFPLNLAGSGENQITYFQLKCYMMFDEQHSPTVISGPYGTTTCVTTGRACVFTHKFFNGVEIISDAHDVGRGWTQVYAHAHMDDYTTRFIFLVNGATITDYEIGSGFFGRMPAKGFVSFSSAFVDELNILGCENPGSPPSFVDDRLLASSTDTGKTGDVIFYDEANERYLVVDGGNLKDPDTAKTITVGGSLNMGDWTDIARAPDSSIIPCGTVSGIIKLKHDSVAVDDSVITNPVTAAGYSVDGRCIIWVPADGAFYASDDGVSWTAADIADPGIEIGKIRIGQNGDVWAVGVGGSPSAPRIYRHNGVSWSDETDIITPDLTSSLGVSMFELVGNTPIVVGDDGLIHTWTGGSPKWETRMPRAGTVLSLFHDGRYVYSFMSSGSPPEACVDRTDGSSWWFLECSWPTTAPSSFAFAGHRRYSSWA